jgi:hypothetical protein
MRIRAVAFTVLYVCATLAGRPGTTLAATPANDNLADAIEITLQAQITGTTQGATLEPGEPSTCLNGSSVQLVGSVWYRVTAPADGVWWLWTEVQRVTAAFIYDGDSFAGMQQMSWACGYDRPNRAVARAGHTYLLRFADVSGLGGLFRFYLELDPPLADDNFAGAATATPYPYTTATVEGDMQTTTIEPGEPTPSCATAPLAKSWWYRVTPTLTSTLQSASGPVQAVYTGSTLADLHEIACSTATLTWDTHAGTTYVVQVGGYATTGGTSYAHVDYLLPSGDDMFSALSAQLPTYNYASGTLRGATSQSGEPTPSCASGELRTVWYALNAAATGTFRVFLSSSSISFAALYSGTPLTGLTERGCTQRADQTSEVRVDVQAGETYFLQLSGWGPYEFIFDFAWPPANDEIAVAEPLPVTHPHETVTRIESLIAARRSPGEPTACAAGKTVWYSVKPLAPVAVTAAVTSFDYAPTLAVYLRTTSGDLQLIACARANGGVPRSATLATPLARDTTYLVEVGSETMNWAGTMTLTIDSAPR